jgi:tetratricopeptide (TPR) repeat protein
MPTDTPDNAAPASRPSVTAYQGFETATKWLELLRKASISVAVVLAISVVTVLIVREACEEGIVIDPVIVQLNDLKEPLTPELAALYIAKHIDAIQRSGVNEWRKLYVDQSPNPIDLQIPGAPLSLRTGVREVAGLLGFKRPTLKMSIVARRAAPSLVGTVGIVGDPGARASCEVEAEGDGMESIFACLALNAVIFIDPKVAASYVFDAEEKSCNGLDTNLSENPTALEREQRRIENRRTRCSFPRTQKLIAKVLQAGRAEDLPWVPYVYGKIHLARAEALTGIDREQQIGELDQAIGRFMSTSSQLPTSTSAIAILFEAFVRKGIAIQESTRRYDWSDDPASMLQWKIWLAESTFNDALGQLRRLPARRSQELDTLVQRIEGTLYFRQWMITAHKRLKSGEETVALGNEEELATLQRSADKYAAAGRYLKTAELFMDWGNSLRALGKFEEAADLYLRAADLAPDDAKPRLKVATAYLERVKYSTPPAKSLHVLIALGAASNYFAWISSGPPFDDFLNRIESALANTETVTDLALFQSCRPRPQADFEAKKMEYLAAAKNCVDQVIAQANGRSMREPRAPVQQQRL